jgi:uncharacterized protein (TIGR02001 family)
MRKYIGPLSAAVALAAPLLAVAQTPPPSPVTGNIALVTDYRFRGLSQTMSDGPFDFNDGGPALQGGFDYAHPSGLYVGNWNSNVSETLFPNSSLEMDFYGGYKKTFGDVGADVGIIYYYYPGSNAPGIGRVDNTELYIGGSWKWLSAKYFHAIDDFFGVPGTKNSWYVDTNATIDLGGGFGIVAHLGHQKVKGISDADYTDWKLGVTKDIGGYVFGAAYVDTNAKDSVYTFTDARKTVNIGDATVVLSVAKTF